jgi:hypothetical protein
VNTVEDTFPDYLVRILFSVLVARVNESYQVPSSTSFPASILDLS